MALDGCLLHIIKEQLNNDAIGARIEKITMPYKDMIIFHLSATGFKCRLLISCEPGAPRIHTTVKKYENPPVPPMMCMLLRKKMVGGRLRGVRQAGIDRVLFLDFDCKNEMSDDVVITVVVEIMGRLSNIAVLQDGKIIDCLTVSQKETDGIGSVCADESFYGQFVGKTEETYEQIDAISGATMTTNGYKKAILRAFEAVKILEGGAQ